MLSRALALSPLLLALVACSGDDRGHRAPDSAALPDVNTRPDTLEGDVLNLNPDTAAQADTTPQADTTTPPDTTTGCNTFGCACVENSDCLEELCVDTLDGRVCSTPCTTTCPDPSFACVPITQAGDPFNACVPQHPNLCKPCNTADDCRNPLQPATTTLCLPAPNPDDGSFCASSCDNGLPCPTGFTCSTVALTGGGTAKQCVPESGMCTCRPAWASMHLTTGCAVTNDAGSCRGSRTCGVDGLTACDATPASAETCNGRDDNCDGIVDNDVPSAACDLTNAAGTCPGTTTCEGGQERCTGSAPSAERCNLRDDNCDGTVDEGTCSDGLACTVDSCVGEDACNHDIQNGFCVIGGVCIADGTPNPANPCQRCNSALSKTDWSGGDQGPSCFIGGVCYPDGATNPTNPCLACNANLVSNSWTVAPAGTRCDDGNTCTTDDVCASGACNGTAYSCAGLGCCVGDGTCTNIAPPGAVEDCSNQIDDDCDGLIDEGTPEMCGDNIDNDCDGEADESGSTWGEKFFARPYTHEGLAKVAIYTSNGDSTFQAPNIIQLPDDRRFSIAAVGDFDGDRYLDLIVTTPATSPPACTSNSQCATGQYCYGGQCLQTCGNPPNNLAICPTTPSAKQAGCPAATECFVVDQFNRTTPNLCFPQTRAYLVRERCPDGATELLELGIRVPLQRDPVTPLLRPGESIITAADANNDGQLDLILRSNWEYDSGATLLKNGMGTEFTRVDNAIKPRQCCGWNNALSGTPKDVDGDGVVDMIGWCNENGGISPALFSWWKGLGDGRFGANAQGSFTGLGVSLNATAAAPASLMTTADFDGDGDMDIVNGLDDDGNAGAVSILINRGSGGALAWAPPYIVYDVAPGSNNGGDNPGVGGGTSFDWDGDGFPDLLLGWTPEVVCASGSGWTCPWRRISVIRNLTKDPCGEGMSCSAQSTCQTCDASCDNRVCGDDGCGGSCGRCPTAQTCQAGRCVDKSACIPQCDGKSCGDNGCGGICGRCAAGSVCMNGSCTANCVPNCMSNGQPKACGSDGCGGQCTIFGEEELVVQERNQSGTVIAPSNAPPSLGSAEIVPAQPRRNTPLTCRANQLYDLDPVTLHFDWYLNGSFFKDAGDVSVLPTRHLQVGQSWHCVIRATDGTEWSIPRTSNVVSITN